MQGSEGRVRPGRGIWQYQTLHEQSELLEYAGEIIKPLLSESALLWKIISIKEWASSGLNIEYFQAPSPMSELGIQVRSGSE